MIFPTVQFAIFFPIVLGLSWLLMGRPRLWKPFMLAASYVFYGAAGWRFAALLALVTLANQAAALLMERPALVSHRKALMVMAVSVDLGVLAVFKYYGFFTSQLNGLLDGLGLGFSAPLAAIAIPL